MKSYTYLVRCNPTGQVYYGVRYAEKRKVEKDIWLDYFTSSKAVHALIEQYGKDAFDVEIRQIFDNKEDAIKWEEKVLRRIKIAENKETWINRNVRGSVVVDRNGTYVNAMHDPEFKEKHSKAMQSNITREKIKKALQGKLSGKNNGFYGKTHSEESKKRIGEASYARLKGVPKTKEHKRKIQEAAKDPQRREKLSKALKGRKFSNETLQKMRIAQQKRREREQANKLNN